MPGGGLFGRWNPGDIVLLRQVIDGRVWAAWPARVVEAVGESAAVWIAPGTNCMRLRGIDGRTVRPPAQWTSQPHRWFGNGNLDVILAREPFSLRLFWDDAGAFAGWYVNLQQPVTVSGDRIDTRDHALDLVLEPDQPPRWKDEDHLEQCVALGIFSSDEAAAIRTAGARFLKRRASYLPTGYESFTPPKWPAPDLPADWATP